MTNEKWQVIKHVEDAVEAAIVVDILKNEGIESKTILKDNKEYMKHFTGNILHTDGIDIYVKDGDALKASEIIEVYLEGVTEEE